MNDFVAFIVVFFVKRRKKPQSLGASFSTIRILTTRRSTFLYMVVLMIAFIVMFCMVVFTVAFTDVSNQRLFVVVQHSRLYSIVVCIVVFADKRLLGMKVNNMASRVKGLVCLWHHEHGRTYRSHDFSGGGRSRVLVS